MTISPEVIQKYARRNPALSTFIETGTFQGTTAIEAAKVFETVHTVEFLRAQYENAARRVAAAGLMRRVHCVCGDSTTFLANVLPQVQGPAFIYLDAHYSGFGDIPPPPVLPLWGELEAIFHSGRTDDVIAIDDIRLCGTNTHPGWEETTVQLLCEALHSINPNYIFTLERGIVLGDVLIAHPNPNNKK